MIDYLAIGLTHGLILLMCWRLVRRDDLDDPAAKPPVVPMADKRRRKRPRSSTGRSRPADA